MKRHVVHFTFAWLTLAAPLPAPAGPITVTNTVDTELLFTVVGSHGPIAASATHVFAPYFSPSGFWFIQLTVTEVDQPATFDPNDKLTISGNVQHIKSPTGHGDGAGVPIGFNFGVDADDATGVPLTVSGTTGDVARPHRAPNHIDTLNGEVTANVIHSGLTIDDITSYDFSITVRHCFPNSPEIVCPIGSPLPEPPHLTEVPEPATHALLGVGLAGLWLLRRQLKREVRATLPFGSASG